MKKTRLVLTIDSASELFNRIQDVSPVVCGPMLGNAVIASLMTDDMHFINDVHFSLLGIEAKVEQFEEADVVESPRS